MSRRRTTVKHVHHGKTPAAWAGAMIALVGFLVATVGFLVGPGGFPSINIPISVAGGVIMLAAPIVGGIMNRVGLGQD
ncbi:hypothetical protein HJ590_05395 [Naumannella sp. ID2617S]|uniref:Uncharacterized protein n=1 Tax=Enemella dayhoffiae TaxID=2016507 RepID=A0A255GWQ8_9ACTN|nr:HGxxPAAW family protein [Enemella dayhoffiae]NNG19016.1 hypothetical protein [Naumannella sp. ID2617S]OYO19253.1 hypothetical protein CGZ93_12760 [Enemella dayhoffiae]